MFRFVLEIMLLPVLIGLLLLFPKLPFRSSPESVSSTFSHDSSGLDITESGSIHCSASLSCLFKISVRSSIALYYSKSDSSMSYFLSIRMRALRLAESDSGASYRLIASQIALIHNCPFALSFTPKINLRSPLKRSS